MQNSVEISPIVERRHADSKRAKFDEQNPYLNKSEPHGPILEQIWATSKPRPEICARFGTGPGLMYACGQCLHRMRSSINSTATCATKGEVKLAVV